MKKRITLFILLSIHVAAFAQTATVAPLQQEPEKNLSNPDDIFLALGITLVATFIFIVIYSLSHALKVLSKKMEMRHEI